LPPPSGSPLPSTPPAGASTPTPDAPTPTFTTTPDAVPSDTVPPADPAGCRSPQ
ncbi:protein phosphatase, partial [Micromonospora chalcea]